MSEPTLYQMVKDLWLRRAEAVVSREAEGAGHEPLRSFMGCRGAHDGDCNWEHCPQARDGEPRKSGRTCPLYVLCNCRDLGDGEQCDYCLRLADFVTVRKRQAHVAAATGAASGYVPGEPKSHRSADGAVTTVRPLESNATGAASGEATEPDLRLDAAAEVVDAMNEWFKAMFRWQRTSDGVSLQREKDSTYDAALKSRERLETAMRVALVERAGGSD